MFCLECGSDNKKMVEDICIDCFLKNFQLIEVPESIDITICSHCNSRLEEGKWHESFIPEPELIYRALERNISINELVENEIIDLEIKNMRGNIAECSVEVMGDVYGEKVNEIYDVSVRILKTVCPTCSKIKSGYYESVVQFRAKDRDIKESEYIKADEIVERTLNKQYMNDKLAYCPYRAKLKEGYDYYIGSLRSGRKIANALKDEFGGVIKESPRLISEDRSTGKGLYRIWISVRIPEFELGDFVRYCEKILQIEDIGKNRVVANDIKTNKKYRIAWNDVEDIELIKKAEDIETVNIISKSPSKIQFLDPVDYSVIDLDVKDGLEDDVGIGDEVKVIKIDDYYLL